MIDQDPVFEKRAARLVEKIREKGLHDARVLSAIARVRRHRFVGPGLQHRAYKDEALPIGLGQTISQPFTVAFQTHMLEVSEGDRILEIGTGSGYQAAVLVALGAGVYTIERHGKLLNRARRTLTELGCMVNSRLGDGTRGWPEAAPFDGIVVTAAAAAVPEDLLEQLRIPDDERRGGRLIVPVGGEEGQTMVHVTRTGIDAYEYKKSMQFRFVPLVSGG